MIPKSVQRFSEKIMLKQEASVARTEGSRNPGQGVMPSITRHHGEIARARRLARASPGRLATEPVVPLGGELIAATPIAATELTGAHKDLFRISRCDDPIGWREMWISPIRCPAFL
jgi:hypothetical protein